MSNLQKAYLLSYTNYYYQNLGVLDFFYHDICQDAKSRGQNRKQINLFIDKNITQRRKRTDVHKQLVFCIAKKSD